MAGVGQDELMSGWTPIGNDLKRVASKRSHQESLNLAELVQAAGTLPIWHAVRQQIMIANEHGTQTSVRGNSG